MDTITYWNCSATCQHSLLDRVLHDFLNIIVIFKNSLILILRLKTPYIGDMEEMLTIKDAYHTYPNSAGK